VASCASDSEGNSLVGQTDPKHSFNRNHLDIMSDDILVFNNPRAENVRNVSLIAS
jgi:hypothetical protein